MLTTHFPIFNDFSCGACSNYNFLLLPPSFTPAPFGSLSHRHHHRRRRRVCFSYFFPFFSSFIFSAERYVHTYDERSSKFPPYLPPDARRRCLEQRRE